MVFVRTFAAVIDAIVIGGGQAGLAAARELAAVGHDVVVLEAHARIGDNWRRRWAGLRLFTPARYSALPGTPFPADDPYHLPTRTEFADYLEAYAKTHDLTVETGAAVCHLTRLQGSGGFAAETTDGRRFEARRIVIASGAYRTPRLPGFAERLPPEMPALHSSEVRDVSLWPPEACEKVLVVGAGASGGQLAVLLSRKRDVVLAGRDPGALPRKVLGRDVYDFLFGLGLMSVRVGGFLGKRLRQSPGRGEVTVGDDVESLARANGIARCGRIEDYEAGVFRTEDGTSLTDIDAVVFATGYDNDYGFVAVPGALGQDGQPLHVGGVSPVEGLYWVGLPMMRRLSSALVGGVGADARHVAASTLK